MFRGDLAGLVLTDVGFKTRQEKATFTPPPWCLAEVTQNQFLAGGMICGKKYADIEDRLKEFGYKKIAV